MIPVLPDSDEVIELKEINRQLTFLIRKERGNAWSILIAILLVVVIIELGVLITMTYDMYGVSKNLLEGMTSIYIRMGNMRLY